MISKPGSALLAGLLLAGAAGTPAAQAPAAPGRRLERQYAWGRQQRGRFQQRSRFELQERKQGERAKVQPGMRDDQVGFVYHHPIDLEDVDVDRPRSPALLADTAQTGLRA